MSANAVRRTIQSIERASAILQLLSGQEQRIGVADLARALALSKAAVHGILRTLQLEGLVEQDDESGKYQLGATLLPLGFRYLRTNRLRIATINAARTLASHTGESVRVGMLHDRQVLIVHHVFRPEDTDQALDIGALWPLHATALGKALLAHHLDLLPALVATGLQRYTQATVTYVARLRRELDESAARGWAADVGELSPGVASIAAPIPAAGRAELGAIGIEGPVERICLHGIPRSDLVSAVIASAHATSREFGAPPWAWPHLAD